MEKFCIHCKHHRLESTSFYQPPQEAHKCARFPDPVTGEAVTDCSYLRAGASLWGPGGQCGPEGKFFEQWEPLKIKTKKPGEVE